MDGRNPFIDFFDSTPVQQDNSEENVFLTTQQERQKKLREDAERQRQERMATMALEEEMRRQQEEQQRQADAEAAEKAENEEKKEPAKSEEDAPVQDAPQGVQEPQNGAEEPEAEHSPPEETKPVNQHSEAQEKRPAKRPSAASPKAKPSSSPKKKLPSKSEVVQLRDFPASVAAYIKGKFQGSPSKSKCLAAYVIANSDFDLEHADDIPQEIRDLAVQLSKKNKKNRTVTVADLFAQLSDLADDNKQTAEKLRELELAVAYLLFDRMGYRQESAPDSPGELLFLEDGVMDLVDRMRAQGKQSVNEDNIRHGRRL